MRLPSTVAFAAAMISVMSGPTQAVPFGDLVPRARWAQAASEIVKIISELTDYYRGNLVDSSNAWEFTKNPDMCVIYMETTDGANCMARVTCNDEVAVVYNADGSPWNSCFQGGQQFLNDPRIGPFSITFTGKDTEGEGLTSPVLQLEYVENWKEFHVKELAWQYWDYKDCVARNGNCNPGPYICGYSEYDYTVGRTRKWFCGVPRSGRGGSGIDSDAPVNDKGYRPGACGLHFTQARTADTSAPYTLEVILYDGNQNEIARTNGSQTGQHLSMGSKLPYTVEIDLGAGDYDPLKFAYAGDSWEHIFYDLYQPEQRCKVGKFDENGVRQGDCGFNCA